MAKRCGILNQGNSCSLYILTPSGGSKCAIFYRGCKKKIIKQYHKTKTLTRLKFVDFAPFNLQQCNCVCHFMSQMSKTCDFYIMISVGTRPNCLTSHNSLIIQTALHKPFFFCEPPVGYTSLQIEGHKWRKGREKKNVLVYYIIDVVAASSRFRQFSF